MLVRTVLHGASTVSGLLAMHTVHGAPMSVRIVFYVGSWIGCAALYVPILYLHEHIIEAWDARIRRIVRDELERRDLLTYRRIIDRERRQNNFKDEP